jgi:pseudouridine synthase
MSLERVQKVLARAGVAARRKSEDLIREGRVTINGEVAKLGDKADASADSIKVDGKRVQCQRSHHYLLINKPRGYLTAVTDDAGRPTVIELVPQPLRKALIPVGRLDYQTEGLLLLTDDGEFAQRISHPRYGCHKTYEVKVKGVPEERQLERLRRGIVMDGRRTSPCRIQFLRSTAGGGREEEAGNSWFGVELSEGRTRQIREMFFRIGHPVQKLRRIAIGSLRDENLPVGAVRELTEKELLLLQRSTERVVAKPSRRPADVAAKPGARSQRTVAGDRKKGPRKKARAQSR